MIVLKFGGTSVGNAINIKKVAAIINTYQKPTIVVLSAVAGTTNALLAINNLLVAKKLSKAMASIEALEDSYYKLADALYASKQYKQEALMFIKKRFAYIRSLVGNGDENEKKIVAQGEIISTNLFYLYQEELGNKSKLISAFNFMQIDKYGEPDITILKKNLHRILNKGKKYKTYITQGFICKNSLGAIDNLKRGGSDYSASLIGASINADEIQIWTDISGMHNNDPRYVENTFSIDEISFDEAAELAYFGAKILHPQSIIPAQKNNIPVLLKNTFSPNDKGTIITNCKNSNGIRAIAAKDGIVAIKIKSYRMLMAYGFLKKVFEVFEKYQTAIDMITTSEIAVSLTIDNVTYLKQIISELSLLGSITVDKQMSIICLAGNFSQSGKGISASVMNCLQEVPVRMISYGGSNYNMSLLVATDDKVEALQQLNKGLFEKKELQKV